MKKRLLIGGAFLASAIYMYSCGGTSTAPQSVDLYLTDAPAQDFPSIIVNVKEVSLCNTGTDTCNPLYKSTEGINVDLTQLNGVLHYVGSAQVPEGTYNRLKVVISNTASVTDNQGNTNQAVFNPQSINQNIPNTVHCDQNAGECVINFNGAVQPFAMGKLIVDFVLKDMEIDTSSNPWRIVKLKMKPITPKSEDDIKDVYYEFYANIENIDSANGSISVSWKNTNYTVNLTDKTVCEINDTNYIGASNCLPQLQTNYCAEIKVNEDPGKNTTLTAIEIELKGQGKCEGEGDDSNMSGNSREMVGTVNSIDSANNTFELSHGNMSTTVKVTDSTVCEHYPNSSGYMYGKDCLTNLTVGWKVEVKLNSNNEALKIEREVETYPDMDD